MQIVNIRVADIKPYENNPRRNTDAVKFVKNSIEQFGFKIPMVLDKNNVIVCGHTRYMAAQELGMKEVPCLYADDLTEQQIKAFRLADNKTAEFAEWDFDLLSDELTDLFEDFDMTDFGFELLDFGEDEHEITEDEVPEEVETRCKLGDTWQLGSQRLICGDSTDVAVIDRLMDGVKADGIKRTD